MEAKRVTDFEHEPYSVTLAKAKRYYDQTIWSGIGVGSSYANNAWNYKPLKHDAIMRATPTVTYSCSNEGTWGSTAHINTIVARDAHWSLMTQKANAAVLDIYLAAALTLKCDAEL